MYRILVFCCSLICSSALAESMQWPSVGTSRHQPDHNWSDFAEIRPDIYPDAWLVHRLARHQVAEVMLRSSSGAMLRWVSVRQLERISSIQQLISDAAETPVDFYITDGSQPNAGATLLNERPSILVNLAMMDLIGEDEDQWAALIGHEVAHLKQQHIQKQARRSIPVAIFKGLAQATLGTQGAIASTAGGMLIDSIGLKFNRDDEHQSDYMGVIWAVQAGYSAHGASALHQKMYDRSGNFPIPFLSSHPSSSERIERLSELADRLDKK